MSRVARKIHIARLSEDGASFDSEQHYLETALRGRTARKVRAHLRRMDPVVLLTPRWSGVSRFLEELALDLAVGEPAIGCRTVTFRSLRGRTLGEAWQFVLHVFGQLGQRGWRHRSPTMVADRRGFRWSMEQLLEEAHQSAPHRVALMAHGAEHLPVEIIEDLTTSWQEYCERHPEGRRSTLLLAASVDAPWIDIDSAPRIDLSDFGEAEAAAVIVRRAGPMPVRTLERVAHLSGGIPEMVDALGRRARHEHHLPVDSEELIHSMGPLADELRGVVDIVAAHGDLSDRLHELVSGEPLEEVEEVDHALRMAGLVRRVRGHGGPRVIIRAPAISSIIA